MAFAAACRGDDAEPIPTVMMLKTGSTSTSALAYVVVVPEPLRSASTVMAASNAIGTAVTVNEITRHEHSIFAASMGYWTSEWSDCGDSCVLNCLMAFCCTWVSMFQVAVRIGAISKRNGMVLAVLLGLFTVTYPFAYYTYIMPLSLQSIRNDHWTETEKLKGKSDPHMQGMLEWWNFALAAVYWITLTDLRVRVRGRFRIPGSLGADCCLSLWCRWCVAAQLASQVQSYKPGTCTFGAPDVLPQYSDEDNHPIH